MLFQSEKKERKERSKFINATDTERKQVKYYVVVK